MLPDLPGVTINGETKKTKGDNCFSVSLPCSGKLPCSLSNEFTQTNRPTEWFQALVQYLQTAGFKAAMCNTWEEILQQLRHESVDLLLVCLGESTIELNVESVLEALAQMALDLPPLLLLDRRLNSNRVELEKIKNSEIIATQVLPRSISMENLLNRINQALSINN
jgi:DNA-binding response OmpR family regulator